MASERAKVWLIQKSADIDEASSCRTTLTCSSPSRRNLLVRAPSELTCMPIIARTKTARKEASFASYVVDSRQRVHLAAVASLQPLTIASPGLIPPDGILSFSEPATLRSIKENKKASSFDSLDKALIVFRHPANATTRPRDMYRRVDLIISRWPSFGAAVMGWSGSTQFERDLRKHAEKLCVRSGASLCRYLLTVGPAEATNLILAGSAFAVRTRLSRR